MGALSSITILLPKKMRSNTNLCQIDSAVDFMTDIVSFSLVREMTQLPNRNDNSKSISGITAEKEGK